MSVAVGDRVRELYASSLVWDAHSGFRPLPTADLENLSTWRDAGVDYLSINVGFDLFPWTQAVATLAAFRHWIGARPDRFALVRSPKQIREAKVQGRMAITFDLEGMNALDGRIEMVELYHSLGVRQMLVAYNRNNLAGGGCHDTDSGLTDFGRAVIAEMNRLGMLVDVTHCGYRTSMEAMEHSTQPVIFSHSNARAICGHERNITDEQIRACAAQGGVIGIVGVNLFLGPAGVDGVQALADHVDYLLNLAGPRHVGIGLDFTFKVKSESNTTELMRANPGFWPPDRGYGDREVTFVSPARLAELAATLLQRGHSEEVIRGVLGGNFERLVGEVWK